ncbi:hypothetical protein I4F81_010222 [Pyropia yezoensis]|uniref:Uncharacterized protein n=1 Tax=Pyropia yezoensis TaxID=2788 RepID=A0ACC3CC11_PYRYE|nr:hypothetical protein I4F81_010222 [Neopyropia yezoensis]
MGRQVAAAAVAAVGRAFIERAAAPATRARALAVTMTGRGAKRRGRGHLLPSAVSPRRAALGRRAAGENFPDGCGAAALTLPDRACARPPNTRRYTRLAWRLAAGHIRGAPEPFPTVPPCLPRRLLPTIIAAFPPLLPFFLAINSSHPALPPAIPSTPPLRSSHPR